MTRPIVGVTMGDAAGIGPEIVLKSFRHHRKLFNLWPPAIGKRRRHAGFMTNSSAPICR